MKNSWEKYLRKKRIGSKGYLRKYPNDILQQSRKEQKEEVKEYSCRQGHQFNAEEATHSLCGGLACPKCPVSKRMGHIEKETVIIIKETQNENVREEDVGKTPQERRQGIQESDQGRCETEETNTCKTKGEKVKKQSAKEKKHEAKETKAFEKKEDKKESKSKKK